MYILAKPLLQPHIQMNILQKPEINPKVHVQYFNNKKISALLHKDLEKAIQRSENMLVEKSTQSKGNERFLNELRNINKVQPREKNIDKDKEISHNYQTLQQSSPERLQFDFKQINRRQTKDHAEFLQLPQKIEDIHRMNTQPQEFTVDDTLFQYTVPNKEFLKENLNFESIVSIAGGNVDEQVMQEMVKNISRKKAYTVQSEYTTKGMAMDDHTVTHDKQVSVRPTQIDQSMQMSIKEPEQPSISNILSQIRLVKNRYYLGEQEDKSQLKNILKGHLNELLNILMEGRSYSNINEAIQKLLQQSKTQLAVSLGSMTKLELFYTFMSEYKAFQSLDQVSDKFQTPIKKRYMQSTQATTLKKKQKH